MPLYAHCVLRLSLFFFNRTPTTVIYTLSLHDALPISAALKARDTRYFTTFPGPCVHTSGFCLQSDGPYPDRRLGGKRSEEHTSELQSRFDLVCRLLLEKKKQRYRINVGQRSWPSRICG